jgi:hypothetical protein
MTYRLSRKAEEDILQIYLTGAAEFGEDQAERYHTGLGKPSCSWPTSHALRRNDPN